MQIWDHFLDELEKDFGKETVTKWLRSLEVLRFDAANLHLRANDSFQALWFEEHIRQRAQTELCTASGKPIKIKLDIVEQKKSEQLSQTSHLATMQFALDPIDPLQTFENFILTQENFLSFQILSELVGYDASSQIYDSDVAQIGLYNPIFLYGESGCGKTHLLSSVTLAMQKQQIQVLYVKAETFTEHMIKAMRMGQMAPFRATYRNSDVFIIDNIEHFANKTATQEEFFHTFNHYHTAGKQIILASQLSPKKLEKIEPRLISRFEWGILLSMQSLPQEKLSLFLLKKIGQLNLFLTKELKEYLTHAFTKPAKLAKALELLSYKAHLDKEDKKTPILQLEEAKTMLQALTHQSQSEISQESILEAVCETFELEQEEVLGKAQTKDVVLPRQLAMYMLRHKLKMPYLKIGKVFSRDHSTVISSVKLMTQKIKTKDSALISKLDVLEKKLAIS